MIEYTYKYNSGPHIVGAMSKGVSAILLLWMYRL